MAVTRWEENNAGITSDASFVRTADAAASGAFHLVQSPGQNAKVITITLPVNHGFNYAMLVGASAVGFATSLAVDIDGTAQPVWSQAALGRTDLAADSSISIYRDVYPQPLTLNPAKGTTQLIHITSVSGGINTFDCIDLITSVSPNASPKRGTTVGHSWAYGVTTGNDGTLLPGRWPLRCCAHLGITEDNQGEPSSGLAFGSYLSGTGAPVVARYTMNEYYNNSVIWTPDWMRVEDGANYTAPQRGGSLAGVTYPSGAQWAARAPTHAFLMHGENDIGLVGLFESTSAGSRAIPVSARNAGGTATVPQCSVGYILSRFIRRMRMTIMRMVLEVPACKVWVFGIGNDNNGAAFSALDVRRTWNLAIQALCQESWIPANTVYYVPILDEMTTGAGIAGADLTHPSEWGHYIIYESWRAVYERVYRQMTVGIQ